MEIKNAAMSMTLGITHGGVTPDSAILTAGLQQLELPSGHMAHTPKGAGLEEHSDFQTLMQLLPEQKQAIPSADNIAQKTINQSIPVPDSLIPLETGTGTEAPPPPPSSIVETTTKQPQEPLSCLPKKHEIQKANLIIFNEVDPKNDEITTPLAANPQPLSPVEKKAAKKTSIPKEMIQHIKNVSTREVQAHLNRLSRAIGPHTISQHLMGTEQPSLIENILKKDPEQKKLPLNEMDMYIEPTHDYVLTPNTIPETFPLKELQIQQSFAQPIEPLIERTSDTPILLDEIPQEAAFMAEEEKHSNEETPSESTQPNDHMDMDISSEIHVMASSITENIIPSIKEQTGGAQIAPPNKKLIDRDIIEILQLPFRPEKNTIPSQKKQEIDLKHIPTTQEKSLAPQILAIKAEPSETVTHPTMLTVASDKPFKPSIPDSIPQSHSLSTASKHQDDLSIENSTTNAFSDSEEITNNDSPRVELVHKAVSEQVSLRVSQSFSKGHGHMRIQLHPASLGEVEVTLQRSGEQTSISFVVDKKETLQLLQHDAMKLEKTLIEIGIFKHDQGSMQFQLKQDHPGGQSQERDGGMHEHPYQSTQHNDSFTADEASLDSLHDETSMLYRNHVVNIEA